MCESAECDDVNSGMKVELRMTGSSLFILLFYHVKLKCMVVIWNMYRRLQILGACA